jgi:hypothetical protein
MDDMAHVLPLRQQLAERFAILRVKKLVRLDERQLAAPVQEFKPAFHKAKQRVLAS